MTYLSRVLRRNSVVAITLFAWLSISNHCAIGALQGEAAVVTRASCHADAPAQNKTPAEGEQTPCCKVLRATLIKTVSMADNALTFSLQPYFVGLIVFPEQLHWPQSFELDTGPPFSGSFAESVLQRSLLAHAPPAFLA